MEPLLAEILDMRRRAPPGSVGRRLAERCLELCLQEISANDEDFTLPPRAAVEELADLVAGSFG